MRKLTSRILPVNRCGIASLLALAVTAGVCEEFLYRGFTMAALSRAGIADWAGGAGDVGRYSVWRMLIKVAQAFWEQVCWASYWQSRELCYSSLAPVMIWHTRSGCCSGDCRGRQYLARRHRRSSK